MKKRFIIMKREILRVIIAVCLITLLISLTIGGSLAFEVPKIPHAFYGDILINSSPAPIDTKVEVKGTGVRSGVSGNPLYTTEIGKYGSPSFTGAKLLAQGDNITNGTILTFFVNDIPTGQTFPFQSGNITELDLIIPCTPEPAPAPVNLLTTSSTGGHVETPGEAGPYYYYPGSDAPLLAVPDVCFSFVEWTGDIGTVDNVTAADSFITMSGNYTIMAVFEPAGIEIPFNAGWNTFSTPVILDDCMDTWDEFIAFNGLQVSMIYGYDSATDSWVSPGGADEILCGHGYYVKAVEAAVAHTAPDPGAIPSVILLSRGVHLIGTPQLLLEAIDVASALATIYEATNEHHGYVLVVSPYINSPNDWEYVRDGSDPPIMAIGRAYWVVIENDSQY